MLAQERVHSSYRSNSPPKKHDVSLFARQLHGCGGSDAFRMLLGSLPAHKHVLLSTLELFESLRQAFTVRSC